MHLPFRIRRAALSLVTVAALGGLIAACGGGDERVSDAEYVASMCSATEEFVVTFLAIAFLSDEDEIEDRFVEGVREFLDVIDGINPPADIEDFHDQLVGTANALLDAVESGDAGVESALEELEELTEPSQEIQDRFEAIAAETEECADANFFED